MSISNDTVSLIIGGRIGTSIISLVLLFIVVILEKSAAGDGGGSLQFITGLRRWNADPPLSIGLQRCRNQEKCNGEYKQGPHDDVSKYNSDRWIDDDVKPENNYQERIAPVLSIIHSR